MVNYVYVLFNSLSKRYESVMSFPSDEMAIHRLTQGGIDKKEFELCRIGSITIDSGVVESYAPVRLVWNDDTELPKSEAN